MWAEIDLQYKNGETRSSFVALHVNFIASDLFVEALNVFMVHSLSQWTKVLSTGFPKHTLVLVY